MRPSARAAERRVSRDTHPTARPAPALAPTERLAGLAPVIRLRSALGAGTVVDERPPQIRQPAGRRTRSFVMLFAILGMLNAVGLTMILSASSVTSMAGGGSPWSQFLKQAMWLLIGLAGMIVALRVDYHQWQRFARPLLLGTVVLLGLVLVAGKRVNGAKRWIGFGAASIQPSELAKLSVLIFVADLLARRSHRIADTRLTLRPVLVVLVTVGVLILRQPNQSTAMLICVIAFVMLYVAGVPARSMAIVALVIAVGAGAVAVATPYRMARLVSFSDPFDDPYDSGYQAAQSQIALSNGDVTGTGFGQGRGKYGYLPEADTDFIFSVVGEETGFLGACVVIGLFLALGALAVKVALRAPDRFGMLVAIGVATWILLQAFVNIGVAVGILPNTGVPLPFLSAGGSSLLFTMIASGILLNISRHTP